MAEPVWVLRGDPHYVDRAGHLYVEMNDIEGNSVDIGEWVMKLATSGGFHVASEVELRARRIERDK